MAESARIGARIRDALTFRRSPKGVAVDIVLGACGVALGLGCAFFPWYVFFNQEEFGIRAMKFEGGAVTSPASGMMPTRGAPVPLTTAEVPIIELDLFTTGKVPDDGEAGDHGDVKALPEQPFPGKVPEFRVVHVTAGRAMLEDDSGVFVVQRGTVLPDDSVVTAIEQRKGRWVVVTDGARVLDVAR